MKTLAALLLLTSCAAPVAAVTHRGESSSIGLVAVERDALDYVGRPDSDPAVIAKIRHRVRTAHTKADMRRLRAFIRKAAHVAH